MAVLVIIRNIAAVAAFVAIAVFLARAVMKTLAPSVKRMIDKRAEYYDVESMDDAEILARKYGVNKEKGKRKRNA